jgi:kinesin family protein 20
MPTQEPCSYITSRLTLIDLAGSERSKHTHATGERLKEAGNINKSLMVLGQCIEVMRANQKRVAQSLAASQSQRSDTRDVKKSLAIVPFRHSKLTEMLMDYFTGEGRVVSTSATSFLISRRVDLTSDDDNKHQPV